MPAAVHTAISALQRKPSHHPIDAVLGRFCVGFDVHIILVE
jgi:hypothetical protein